PQFSPLSLHDALPIFDGWIHASHGFSNVSVVAGSDGDSVRMVSGNTFRFRMDGSRVEKASDGRINPFGSDYDEMGYHYSADCHTDRKSTRLNSSHVKI